MEIFTPHKEDSRLYHEAVAAMAGLSFVESSNIPSYHPPVGLPDSVIDWHIWQAQSKPFTSREAQFGADPLLPRRLVVKITIIPQAEGVV